jgi:hypothetical protein
MLVDAYRYPNVDGPTRNYTYIQAVDRYLGARAPPPPPPPPPPHPPPKHPPTTPPPAPPHPAPPLQRRPLPAPLRARARAPPPRLNLPQLMRGAQAGRT